MKNCRIIVAIVLLLAVLVVPAYAYEELAKGSKGEPVVELQERLNELGYSVGNADGDYGSKTAYAVAEFQLNNALSMTGVANVETLDILFSDDAKGKSKIADKNQVLEEEFLNAAGLDVDCGTTNINPEDYIYVGCNRTNNNELQVVFDIGIGTQSDLIIINNADSDTVAYFCTLMYKYSACFDILVCEGTRGGSSIGCIYYKAPFSRLGSPLGETIYEESELIEFLFAFTELAEEYTPSPNLTNPFDFNPVTLAEEVKFQVGDVITLGTYEQDGNTGNGKEAITWQVLAVEDGKALVISEIGLAAMSYGTPMDITSYTDDRLYWETSYVRKWLNDDFLAETFSDEEHESILVSQVTTNDAYGNCATEDNLFCLSIDEADQYFDSAEAMACGVSEVAKKGLHVDDGAITNGYGNWLLRDMTSVVKPQQGSNFMSATYNEFAYISGTYGTHHAKEGKGMPVFCDYLCVVRPAMWISSSVANVVETNDESATNVVDKLTEYFEKEYTAKGSGGEDSSVLKSMGKISDDIELSRNSMCALLFNGGYYLEYEDEEGSSYLWVVPADDLEDSGTEASTIIQAFYLINCIDEGYFFIYNEGNAVSLSRYSTDSGVCDNVEDFQTNSMFLLSLFTDAGL